MIVRLILTWNVTSWWINRQWLWLSAWVVTMTWANEVPSVSTGECYLVIATGEDPVVWTNEMLAYYGSILAGFGKMAFSFMVSSHCSTFPVKFLLLLIFWKGTEILNSFLDYGNALHLLIFRWFRLLRDCPILDIVIPCMPLNSSSMCY